MTRFLLICACMLLGATAHADCSDDPDSLAAVYRLSESRENSEADRARKIVLWRDGRRVAHEYPDTELLDLWEATRNKRLRLVRYFDAYSHGIEYDPSELTNGDGEHAWQRKRQLVPDAVMDSLEPLSTSGAGCDTLVSYEWQESGLQHQLEWLTHRQLPERYTISSESVTTSWQLERLISDQAEITANFARRDAYQTTDYADIGDNESDPFLQKMINMGFLDHDH